MDIKYPVECPLMGNKYIDMDVCFDIHMVVSGDAPDRTAPKEIFEHDDFKEICTHCKFHRND